MECIFLDTLVIPYVVPLYMLIDNTTQLISKCFGTLRTPLGTKDTKKTPYHPQTNRKVECYNNTTVNRLRQYVATHRSDWNCFVLFFPYEYNTQVDGFTNTPPFSLVLTRHPPWPIIFDNSSTLATDANYATDQQASWMQLHAQNKSLQIGVSQFLDSAQGR